MRKIHEIAYEFSRFRGVLNFMGIESGRTGILKYFKMSMKNSKAVPKFRKISKIQAAVGKFQFFNVSNLSTNCTSTLYQSISILTLYLLNAILTSFGLFSLILKA